jgi:hypothetical protein
MHKLIRNDRHAWGHHWGFILTTEFRIWYARDTDEHCRARSRHSLYSAQLPLAINFGVLLIFWFHLGSPTRISASEANSSIPAKTEQYFRLREENALFYI